MQNFTYHNTVKIVFGQDSVKKIGGEAAPFGKKALLVYGKGSVKANGLYDTVVQSLNQAGIETVDFSGVSPNPRLSHTLEGIALAKKEKIDLIIALGGGSVIDESKAIAMGTVYSGNVWDFYLRKATPKTAIPLCVVLTVAATGTEMNGGTVITNEETKQKFGITVDAAMPKVSILDPNATFTVGAKYTAYAGVDIFAHILEGYITNDDPETPIQNRYAESLMKTDMEMTVRCIEEPTDYQARANMMWCSTMAWNGLLLSGIGTFGYPGHLIGHSMSCLYDTPHGASLSIALPSWMRKVKPLYTRKLSMFARNVMNVQDSCDDSAIDEGILRLENWFRQIHSPVNFSEAGIPLEGFEPIVENIAECAPVWGLPMYTKEFVSALLAPACK